MRWNTFLVATQALCGAASLVLALSACHPVGQNSARGERVLSTTIPHVLRYATDEDIATLNPWFNSQLILGYMAQMTMAYLFRYDHHNQLIPELATQMPTLQNGGISADGKTLIFHIRKGVTWSDGAKFSADDVVYSIQQMLNPKNNVGSRDGWDRIDKIEEPDSSTIKIHIKMPYSEFVSNFFSSASACVLPKHLLVGRSELNDAPYNSLPVGIGPFKYLRWERGSSVVMVPNASYFRGVPKLKRVEFHIVTDPNTIETQLKVGELDLWIPARSFYIDELLGIPNFQVVRKPSYMFQHLDFNLSNPILADRRVRYALRAATDRETMLQKISHRIGVVQESYLSPEYPNAPPPIPAEPYNLVKANRLLDQAGWVRDSDGIRMKNGRRLELNVAVGDPTPDVNGILEILRSDWKQIGASFQIHNYGSPLFFGTYQSGGIIQRGKFDITLFSWQIDPMDNMIDVLGCKKFPPNGQNNTHYCNPQADAVMVGFNSTYDPLKQRAYKAQLMKLFVADAPMVVLKVSENLYAASRDLKHFNPNQVTAFDDMMQVDI